MKTFLMHQDKDFVPDQVLPDNYPELIKDLELDILFQGMAGEDKFIFDIVKTVIFSGTKNPEEIRYRQAVLKDCLKNPDVVRNIYDLAVETIETRRKHHFGIFSRYYPSSILYNSKQLLEMFMTMLAKLMNITNTYAGCFLSEGFTALFTKLKAELDEEYFALVRVRLSELEFKGGTLISTELGKGNKDSRYVLRKIPGKNGNWLKKLLAPKTKSYSFSIHPRDESGTRALAELKDQGINYAANALAQSSDHILSFFLTLRTELAFYVGCLNLYDRLTEKGMPVFFPVPSPFDSRINSFKGLYDVCLALNLGRRITGNDAAADNKDLIIITGANQGGKSTFLRSLGTAQLMMQCGMFVPAESFSAGMCRRIFTHFKRQEDSSMKSGKFDEELRRMSEIADAVLPDSLILFNESFAATNEREGAEISRQIISALLENRIRVCFVTHSFELAHGLYEKNTTNAIFFRAERRDDGVRTFKLIEAEPLATCFGEDLYNEIFGTAGREKTEGPPWPGSSPKKEPPQIESGHTESRIERCQ